MSRHYTVWYAIEPNDTTDKALSVTPWVFASGLDEASADIIATNLPEELKFILGDDLPVKAWVE